MLTASTNDLFKISTPHPVKKIMVHPWRVYRSGSRVTSPAATQATFSANHWEVKPEPITSFLQPFLFRAWRWIHLSVLICDWVVSLLFEQKAVAFIWFYDARSKNAQRAFCTQWARSHTHPPSSEIGLSREGTKIRLRGRGTCRACWCWTVDRKVFDHFLNASDIFII